MKKQMIAFLSTAALFCGIGCAAVPVSAEGTAPKITITVASQGNLEVAAESLTVTDADNDGALTINDALILVHDAKFTGGAAAGYATAATDWGMSITKLWGVENGGSYSYTVNNAFANGLSDPISDGDYVYAYVYKDATGYSDQYSYFDIVDAGEVEDGTELTLTLKSLTFDSSFQQQILPVAGAGITVNGKATQYVTDADGKVTMTLSNDENILISATSNDKIIVPPVCKAVIKGGAVNTTTTADAAATTTTSTTTTSANVVASQKNVQVAGAKTGDSNAIPALAIAGILAGCTAFMMRRDNRDD